MSNRLTSSLRPTIILLLLTVAAIGIHGYHAGIEDDGVYLPAIKRNLNPALFPHDADFFALQLQATVFDKVVALTARLMHAPAEYAVFAWQFIAVFLFLGGCWAVAKRCFSEANARWAAVGLVAALLTMPVSGTALYIIDQHLHPRALASAAVLFAVAAVLDGRKLRAALLIVVAALLHPLMASFGASFCVFLGWPSRVSKPLPSRRDEFARVSAALVPLGWIFEKPDAAWHEAAATRSYYFLGQWAWYEWLGVFAPLLVLWGMSRVARRTNAPAVERVSSRLVPWGVFQLAVALVMMLPTALERTRPWQPMRYLHLQYVLMLLLGGGLLGRYVLRRSAWRWAVLFVPLAAAMFYVQRDEFANSAHLELPGRVPHNEWVQAFEWVRVNTPANAYFTVDPKYMERADYHSFRALAERSALADDVKDPAVATQVPRLASRWLRERDAQRGFGGFTFQDFERLKADFGVNWAMVEKSVAGLDCPYTNSAVRVCRIP